MLACRMHITHDSAGKLGCCSFFSSSSAKRSPTLLRKSIRRIERLCPFLRNVLLTTGQPLAFQAVIRGQDALVMCHPIKKSAAFPPASKHENSHHSHPSSQISATVLHPSAFAPGTFDDKQPHLHAHAHRYRNVFELHGAKYLGNIASASWSVLKLGVMVQAKGRRDLFICVGCQCIDFNLGFVLSQIRLQT